FLSIVSHESIPLQNIPLFTAIPVDFSHGFIVDHFIRFTHSLDPGFEEPEYQEQNQKPGWD
ncbi:hypothetical protein LCGC14_3094500, partial [marine sediment metagenome]